MVLINMDMPANCIECRFATKNVEEDSIMLHCVSPSEIEPYGQDSFSFTERPQWCPLRESVIRECIVVDDAYENN